MTNLNKINIDSIITCLKTTDFTLGQIKEIDYSKSKPLKVFIFRTSTYEFFSENEVRGV